LQKSCFLDLLRCCEVSPRRERIFGHYKTLQNSRRSFERYRIRAEITFHTLRHWKGTMEYYKTKDILHVMQLLGHKNIKNTLIYTQLVKNLSEDEYICRVAKTPSEVQELIEAGFEYVCAKEDCCFSANANRLSRAYSKSPLWCRGPDLNRRQPGLQLHPQPTVLSRVLSQSELPRPLVGSAIKSSYIIHF